MADKSGALGVEESAFEQLEKDFQTVGPSSRGLFHAALPSESASSPSALAERSTALRGSDIGEHQSIGGSIPATDCWRRGGVGGWKEQRHVALGSAGVDWHRAVAGGLGMGPE